MDASDSLFEVLTPLGFRARVTTARWKVIANAKHPVIAGREPLVKTALEAPDEVHQSRVDAQVVLFYKAEARKRRTCAVLKRVADGALLKTA